MTGVADTIQLSISLDAPSVTQPSLKSLLIAGKSSQFSERTREYSSVEEILEDNEAQLTVSDYEYKAAAAVFGQTPTLSSVKIGRVDESAFAAQVTNFTTTTGDDGTYVITLDGVPFTHVASGETATQVMTALFTAINLSTLNLTAVDNTGDIDVTSDTAGDGFTWTVSSPNDEMSGSDTTPNVGWETEMAAIGAEDNDFYFVVAEGRTEGVVEDVAKYVEANKKLYIAQSSASGIGLVEGATPDLATRLKNQSLTRTALLFYLTDSVAADAAWAGLKAAADPDSVSTTWCHATLAGIAIDTVTTTQQGFAEGKNANVYYELGGVGATWEGKVAGGHYIDTIVTRDWTEIRMTSDLQQVFLNASNRNSKVAYTNRGIASLADTVRERLETGQNIGHYNPDTEPVVNFTQRQDAAQSDVTNRISRGTFQAEVAGAVHKTIITGSVVSTLS